MLVFKVIGRNDFKETKRKILPQELKSDDFHNIETKIGYAGTQEQGEKMIRGIGWKEMLLELRSQIVLKEAILSIPPASKVHIHH